MDLYRFFDADGTLLYIGISLSAAQRASQHRAGQPWWHEVTRMDVEHLGTTDRAEAEALERWAIQNERPLYNRTHNGAYSHTPTRRPTPSEKERAIYDAAIDVMTANGPCPIAREEVILAVERAVYNATFDYMAARRAGKIQ